MGYVNDDLTFIKQGGHSLILVHLLETNHNVYVEIADVFPTQALIVWQRHSY